jgi:hypothetical protein
MVMTRFTLRDVFWLTLVVACLCAWWMERVSLTQKIRETNIREENARADFEQLSSRVDELGMSVFQVNQGIFIIPDKTSEAWKKMHPVPLNEAVLDAP